MLPPTRFVVNAGGGWELNRQAPSVRFLPRIIRFLGYDPLLPGGPTFPNRLQAARQRLGLSQAALAQRLGVNESTVADWEAGRTRPTKRSRRLLKGFFPGLDG